MSKCTKIDLLFIVIENDGAGMRFYNLCTPAVKGVS